jgi:uncharacterized protein (TIGR03435 family)
MLQPLLADRFRLETRWETRRMPVYELSAAKRASKLKRSTCTGTPSFENPCGTFGGSPGTITGRAATLDVLAQALSEILGREVLNKTGIQGTYDFNLSWTPDTAVGGNVNGDDLSIFTAVREQLGMKLTPAIGPVEILVIVDARRPTPN